MKFLKVPLYEVKKQEKLIQEREDYLDTIAIGNIRLNTTKDVFELEKAQFLKELRTEKHLSMKQLAKQLSTTDATISNWENEINEPKLSHLIAIAKFFNVSIDYLAGIEE